MDDLIIPITPVPKSYTPLIRGVSGFLLGFAYLSVALRFYTRLFLIRNLGWDDITVLISLLLFTGYLAILIILTLPAYLATKSILHGAEITVLTNLLLASESLYILCIGVLKISLGLFLLRNIFRPRIRILIYCILVLFTLYGIADFFFVVFQCGVPHGSSFWRKKLVNKCVSYTTGSGMTYTHASLTAATDIIFFVLPISLIVDSNLKYREKWLVGCLLCMGAVGCIASFVRMKYISVVTTPGLDFYRSGVFLAIWSGVEPGLGIIASSLACTRPLIRRVVSSARFSQFTASVSWGSSSGRKSTTSNHTTKTFTQSYGSDVLFQNNVAFATKPLPAEDNDIVLADNEPEPPPLASRSRITRLIGLNLIPRYLRRSTSESHLRTNTSVHSQESAGPGTRDPDDNSRGFAQIDDIESHPPSMRPGVDDQTVWPDHMVHSEVTGMQQSDRRWWDNVRTKQTNKDSGLPLDVFALSTQLSTQTDTVMDNKY